MRHQEVITRRNLPHWYVPGAMHFLTYRLDGTIPQQVLACLRETSQRRLQGKPTQGESVLQHRERVHKQFFADYDRYLDHTCKIDWLARPPVAALIRSNLYHHAGSKYELLAYCVMPNHVHALLLPLDAVTASEPLAGPAGGALVEPASKPLTASEPLAVTSDETAREPLAVTSDERKDAGSPLAAIVHSLKSYTAHEANKMLGRTGQFWLHESYDHWVRDDEELERIVDYIAWNPVKANLVKEPHEWFFGSAHDRFLQDGSRAGYLC